FIAFFSNGCTPVRGLYGIPSTQVVLTGTANRTVENPTYPERVHRLHELHLNHRYTSCQLKFSDGFIVHPQSRQIALEPPENVPRTTRPPTDVEVPDNGVLDWGDELRRLMYPDTVTVRGGYAIFTDYSP